MLEDKNAYEFLKWPVEDLLAYAKYGYDEKENVFWGVITDGTKIDVEQIPVNKRKSTYYKRGAGGYFFYAYVLGYKLSKKKELWDMARKIGKNIGIGDIGETGGKSTKLNLNIKKTDVDLIFGLLELCADTKDKEYLKTAMVIGDNIIEYNFYQGLFGPGKEYKYCKFDNRSALALLHLAGEIQGKADKLPQDIYGRGYYHAYLNLQNPSDKQRPYDNQIIWDVQRGK